MVLNGWSIQPCGGMGVLVAAVRPSLLVLARSRIPPRLADDRAEIAAMEVRFFVGYDVRVDVTERCVGLMPYAVIECLDDVFLEPLAARVGAHDRVPDVIGKVARLLSGSGVLPGGGVAGASDELLM